MTVESLTHLFNGMQQLTIAENNDQEGDNQAKNEEADDVRNVIGGLGCPVYRAGGSRAFWAIAAPTK